jgi:CBS domain protein
VFRSDLFRFASQGIRTTRACGAWLALDHGGRSQSEAVKLHCWKGSLLQVHDASTESKIHFDEPVKSLLLVKGRAVWSIWPEATVYEAIDRMSEIHIGALVVVSAEKLVGIISEARLCT